MFKKRNLASVKNRKQEEPAEAGGAEVLNPAEHVKLFKKRAIARVGVTESRAATAQKSDFLPLDSNTVDLQVDSAANPAQEAGNPVNRATSTYEIDTDASVDTRSILERNLEIGKKILAGELEANVYRGKGAYKPVMNVREGSIAASKYTGLYGPVRASATNVRTTLRIDYQPDVCKDYKETGYCGFGDTCKFLHDRSDYKSGWQLEKEWEQEQAEKRLKMQKKLDRWHKKMQSNEEEESEPESTDSDSDDTDSDSSESDDEPEGGSLKQIMKYRAKKLKVPFCCLSCKELWKAEMNPVVTSCGHYFCERCLIEAYASNMKCPKCQTVQDGIMNRASAVEKLLESVRKHEP